MIQIPNQPVNFETDPFNNPWISEAKYKQLVNQGDVTQFQLLTTEQNNSENLLENPSFDNVFDPWQISGQFGQNTFVTGWHYSSYGNNKVAQTATQYGKLIVGSWYYIEVRISVAYNGYAKIYLGDNHIGNKQSGTHIMYGECTGNTSFSIVCVPFINFTGTSMVVDYAVAYDTPIANHRFTIEQMDGTLVKEIPVITTYLNTPYAVDTDVAQLVKSFLTMSIDWTTQGISNGCYRIGVCDGDLSTNAQCGVINSEFEAITGVAFGQTFTNTTGAFAWVIGLGGMTLTSLIEQSKVRFDATAPVQSGTLTQVVLKSGVEYNYSIRVTGSTGEKIIVNMGTQSTPHTTNATDQTFTGTITSDGTDLVLSFTSTAGGKSMQIDHFRIESTDESLEPNFWSNPFELATDHDRTVVVNASNSNDAFGLEFDESLWSPRLRMKGYTAPSDAPYKNDRLSITTSVGNRKNYYLKRRKSRVLVVDQEPEFIHDWLSLLCGFDHVYVDNVEQFVDDDAYNPIIWDKFRITGATEINISAKIQNVEKVREHKENDGFIIASDNPDLPDGGGIQNPPKDGDNGIKGNETNLLDPTNLAQNDYVVGKNSPNAQPNPTNAG